MDMLISFALTYHFRFLSSPGVKLQKNSRRRPIHIAYLVHCISILTINVLDDAPYLTLQLEFLPFLKVQPRRVNDREQHPVKTRLANLYTSRLNRRRGLGRVLEEPLNRSALVHSRRRRELGRFEEQTEQRRLSRLPAADNLKRISQHLEEKKKRTRKARTIRLNVGDTRALR